MMGIETNHQMAMDDRPDHGRHSGLEAVYLAQRPALVRFLRARGATDDAEDLIQELWLRLLSTSATPIADPVSYLFRAANNLMISRYRSTERSERRDHSWNASGPSAGESTEAAVAARQEIILAEERLRGLGQRVLRTFTMFRVHGVSQSNVAIELGVSLSTVEKDLQRAYRAIAALKDELDAE